MQTHETFEALLMKAVDGKLSDSEHKTLDQHLQACGKCREELEDFQSVKKSTDSLVERVMRDAAIIPIPERKGTRRMVQVATVFFMAGLVLLFGYAAHAFMFDGEVPLFVKISVFLLAFGTVLLAGLAIYQRIRGLSRDPYQEIDL